MIKKTVLAGVVALAFVAACSKQEPPAAVTEDQEEEAVEAAAAPEAPPAQDYSITATGVMSLLADVPECQRYFDELREIAKTPLGTQAPRDPAEVVAEAHAQGCSKKARGLE
jgi:hypothetical protein